MLDETLIKEIDDELTKARKKFPKNRNLNLALQEEVGEFARAQLQDGSYKSIQLEGVQVIVLVLRILAEGDASIVCDEESTQK
jgi:hypothetical protein